MKTNLFNLRHHGALGPGGWKCYCCGPAPSMRKFANRSHKRKVSKILDKLFQE